MNVDPSAGAVATRCAVCGWVEREARLALATQPLRRALNQREHYTDLRGVNHPLSDMTVPEVSLVLAVLETHAATLHRGELAERLVLLAAANGPRPKAIEAYAGLAAAAAEDWLRQTPLHRALSERAAQ